MQAEYEFYFNFVLLGYRVRLIKYDLRCWPHIRVMKWIRNRNMINVCIPRIGVMEIYHNG